MSLIKKTGARTALLITVYDEVDIVCRNIKEHGQEFDFIGVVQSGNKVDDKIHSALQVRTCPTQAMALPNLADASPDIHRAQIPAMALTRNYSALFSMLKKWDMDCAVAITGDTQLAHLYGIEQYLISLGESDKTVACTRALGQDFHSADKTPEDIDQGRHGGRKQETDMADFMPQFFIVKQDLFDAFGQIPLTNVWCSEQCLGDCFYGHHLYHRSHGDDPLDFLWVISNAPYIADGIVYHAKG